MKIFKKFERRLRNIRRRDWENCGKFKEALGIFVKNCLKIFPKNSTEVLRRLSRNIESEKILLKL